MCRLLLTEHLRATETDNLVTIKPESTTTIYRVSRVVLCEASDYFRKALEGDFEEGTTQELCLPDCDKTTVQLLLYFILNLELPVFDLSGFSISILDGFCALVRLWVAADTFLMFRLQVYAMDRIYDVLKTCDVPVDGVELVFHLTAEASVLRSSILQEVLKATDYDSYTKEEIERLAAIPGFFYEFQKAVRVRNNKSMNKGMDDW